MDDLLPHGSAADAHTPSDRAAAWAGTMSGHLESTNGIRHAHAQPGAAVGPSPVFDRSHREELEHAALAPGATRGVGAGNRAVAESPDPERTCFERDRDRILHSSAFRRLAGKTQVFVLPEDHQRTRLTHALEVAQVATAIARSVGLNVALTEAIAIGHDCGHGPGGHASEDAFTPYIQGGYDHAEWGANVVLAPLNLCEETLDGIRNHSWSRPCPTTPEGEVVSWADRIAYVCHDFEDAVHVGIVSPEQLPPLVRERCGDRRSRQLHTFIADVVATVRATGSVGMSNDLAEALAAFRRFNYEHIYMRPASLAQSAAVIRVLQALVEHHADHPYGKDQPNETPPTTSAGGGSDLPIVAGSAGALERAVTYVGGMTDRYAFDQARLLLGWSSADLPKGIG